MAPFSELNEDQAEEVYAALEEADQGHLAGPDEVLATFAKSGIVESDDLWAGTRPDQGSSSA